MLRLCFCMHFHEGLFVLAAGVSSGSLLRGSVLAPLLLLRHLLHIASRVVRAAMSLCLLHISVPRWHFLLTHWSVLVGLLYGGFLLVVPSRYLLPSFFNFYWSCSARCSLLLLLHPFLLGFLVVSLSLVFLLHLFRSSCSG